MKRLKKYPSIGLFCMLLFFPFMVAGPSLAECNMTSANLDAAVTSCNAGELDCFVSLAKSNISCAANIAWYFMIVYAPDNPDAVLNRFLNALPYSYALTEGLNTSIGAAHRANQNEQKTGSTTAANEYPYGQ